jgi:hypothetical protein
MRVVKDKVGWLLAEQIPMFDADGDPSPADVMYLAYGRHDHEVCGSCFFCQSSRDPEGLPMTTCAKYPLAGIPAWMSSFGACGLFARGGGG